jgi:hypothetical protein
LAARIDWTEQKDNNPNDAKSDWRLCEINAGTGLPERDNRSPETPNLRQFGKSARQCDFQQDRKI